MKKNILVYVSILFCVSQVYATKLVEVKVVDKDFIIVYFKDGEVVRRDNGIGNCAYEGHCHSNDGSSTVWFGTPLQTNNAINTANWSITSTNHAYYNTARNPQNVYRKTKPGGMNQSGWQGSDYTYDYTLEHWIYLRMPQSMQQGSAYTIQINGNTNTDVTSLTFTYDIFQIKSEAIHVNLVGYAANSAIKAADLYHWMGDGGARDYSSFVGNTVYIYNVNTQQSQAVGQVTFWRNSAVETHTYNFTRSNVWNIDFTGFTTPGTYRLAVEGVGCSEDFVISDDVYRAPFKVSTRGFFYMRVGEDNKEISPRPREPLFIPGVDGTTVYITTMHRQHPNWGTFASGDPWDVPNAWAPYSTGRTNPNAWGGHSDAYDWDRHLGHVSIIWDMLLPYILTNGAIGDDDLGISESGNGIPDIIDEARFEVDFFLRIRDGKSYSQGLTCPISNTNRVIYQAGGNAISAWANALNSSMLAESFRISGHTALMQEYTDSAVAAYTYAKSLADQMLNTLHNFGEGFTRGRDMKMSAAAYLYNLTGDTYYENEMASESNFPNGTSAVVNYQTGQDMNQLYGIAAYLTTPRPVNYPALQNNMRASIILEAKQREANYSTTRPTRRAVAQENGYFVTVQNVQRTILAHAVATDPADIEFFERALYLEADWGLGRNPANIIQMTTASTSLADKKSVQAAYTSGYNDGVPGLHPGHTPYWNIDCWFAGMVMACPTRIAENNYPVYTNWPQGELYFDTDYSWAHGEFTPQQTMRGKQALYGYLYGINNESACPKPILGPAQSICGHVSIVLNSNLDASGRTFVWRKDGAIIPGANVPTLTVTEAGLYEVITDESGCENTASVTITNTLPSVNLGDDVHLCNPATAVLDAGVSGSGISYSWQKDGATISGAESQTLTVTEAGVYAVTISASGCPSQTGSVTVTSALLEVSGDERCNGGMVTLAVIETGSVYEWYDLPENGTLLHTGQTYSPTISETTTFYVADASGFETAFGPNSPQDYSVVWGTWDGAKSDKIKFEVFSTITLKSVDVFRDNATSITARILAANLSTIVGEQTIASPVAGRNTLVFNLTLTPGTYYIDAVGTVGQILMNGDNSDIPDYSTFGVPGVIQITGTEPAWIEGNKRWLFFYNWQVAAGNPCLRTPVTGIINPEGTGCSGDTEPPTIPGNATFTAITQSSFTASWTASTDNVGVTGYDVYLDGVLHETVTGTSISISGLSCNTQYAIRVRARDAAGNASALNTEQIITTTGIIAPIITSNSPTCESETIQLSISEQIGATYAWTGPSGYTANTVAISRTNATTVMAGEYSATITVGGCTSLASTTLVTVTPLPAAPTVTTPVTYQQNETASQLTATGSNLLWYTVPSGGIGEITAPTPSTASIGTVSYYVSQTVSSCESSRAEIEVVVESAERTQTITLEQGWNLISVSVIDGATPDNQISTIFEDVDVAIVKNADGFWKLTQAHELNSLHRLEPGKGYLVYMNSAGTIEITGMIVQTPNLGVSTGWQLIGYPCTGESSFSPLPISDYFDETNCQTIKNFEGFWIPNGDTNSINNFEQGKGYYLFR